MIQEFDIMIYEPTGSNPYYQVIEYEDGRRRTTTSGTTYGKAGAGAVRKQPRVRDDARCALHWRGPQQLAVPATGEQDT